MNYELFRLVWREIGLAPNSPNSPSKSDSVPVTRAALNFFCLPTCQLALAKELVQLHANSELVVPYVSVRIRYLDRSRSEQM